MNHTAEADPYILDSAGVREPPVRIITSLRYLGPGLIITGNIVGSGELIATPALAARVGISALWLIIFSCIIKIFLQAETARYTISSGETSLQALNRFPGSWLGLSWPLWCYMLMMLATYMQVGGIMGGLGQTFTLLIPAISPLTGSILAGLLAGGILLVGRYGSFEKVLVFMVATFSLVTILCAFSLIWAPHPLTVAELWQGLQFNLPAGGLAIAFSVFGLVGVGSSELIYYPYWLIEKGYARFSGRCDESPEWARRARGWVRVMYLDVVLAMLIYTFVTVAFYLLGVSTLYAAGLIPEGFETVRILSNLYTSILGSWAFVVFLVGVFAVLFSTLLVATASNARIIADLMQIARLYNFRDYSHRRRWFSGLSLSLLALYILLYGLIGEPVMMVFIGGFAQAAMLPIIATSTIRLRYFHLDKRLRPNRCIDILLVVSSLLIIAFALYSLRSQILPLFQR